MIIHRLILQHLGQGDFNAFYRLQAQDAIQWLQTQGVVLSPETEALDLGCGHGIFGAELLRLGCRVTFADEGNYLFPDIPCPRFLPINLNRDDVRSLGTYDLVICSNVLEHLASPDRFLSQASELLKPGGYLYLSWTNWLSPWGGHEFSPFHYLGPKRGHRIYDRLIGKKRNHTPFQNLFPTYIGSVLRRLREQPGLQIVRAVPRYYPEFSFILALPLLREFLTWNCAVLLRKSGSGAS